MEEPVHVCPQCGREPKYPDDKFCSIECEWEYNELQKPKTVRQAAIIKIAPNGDESFHD